MWILLRIAGIFLPTLVYHTFDDKLYSWYQRCVLLFYGTFVTQKIYFYGDHDYVKRKENVIYMCNHQSTVDWVITSMIIARQGGIGRLRFILLNALKYIPVFGYYFYQHCFIFVNRDNFEAHKAMSTMEYIKKKYLSCWIVAYPEVDRFNPNKPHVIEESRRFAKSKECKPMDYHLTPRPRGMEILLNNMFNYLDAVYDVTIVFGDGEGRCLDKKQAMPGLFSYLMKPRTLHIHLQRIPIADVPVEHTPLRTWLNGRFALKDQLFRELDPSKNGKKRQPSAKDVSAAFHKVLSTSKVPNSFGKFLPNLRKGWLFTAVSCLSMCTLFLLVLNPFGIHMYGCSIVGAVFLCIPYLYMAV